MATRGMKADLAEPLTLGRNQQLAGHGAPADGVHLSGGQTAPEIMAAVVLKALVPQQSFVPWRHTGQELNVQPKTGQKVWDEKLKAIGRGSKKTYEQFLLAIFE